MAILGVGVALLWSFLHGRFGDYVATDIDQYLRATRRWVETGTPYVAAEVAGPFDFSSETFLHPPVALYLLAPFLVLPGVLWWAIPLGVTGYLVWSWHPAPWTWPLLALALAHPRFHGALIVGNTDLWVLASVAAGLRFGWPALLVTVKPSLAFLALVGMRHPSWWAGGVLVAIACLPFGPLWLDWIRVVQHSPGDLTYSLPNLPWLMAPLVAWAGRRGPARLALRIPVARLRGRDAEHGIEPRA